MADRYRIPRCHVRHWTQKHSVFPGEHDYCPLYRIRRSHRFQKEPKVCKRQDVAYVANRRYSLLLSDTIKVGKEGSTVLTDGCTKLKDVVMELDVSRIIRARLIVRRRSQSRSANHRRNRRALEMLNRMAKPSHRSSRGKNRRQEVGSCPVRHAAESGSKWSRPRVKRSRRTNNGFINNVSRMVWPSGRAVTAERQMERTRLSSGTRVIDERSNCHERSSREG